LDGQSGRGGVGHNSLRTISLSPIHHSVQPASSEPLQWPAALVSIVLQQTKLRGVEVRGGYHHAVEVEVPRVSQ
jgi:hypothetical protein